MAKIKSNAEKARDQVQRLEEHVNHDAKVTKCPITRQQFKDKAAGILSVVIDSQQAIAERKEFSTGSFGWGLNGKMTMLVDGVPVKVQVGLNLTVVGSKEA